jgi:hypothetical protein
MKLMTDEQVYNYKNENPAIPWRSLCAMMTGKPQHGADAQEAYRRVARVLGADESGWYTRKPMTASKPYDDSDAALGRTRKTVTVIAPRVLSDRERKRVEYIEKELASTCIKYAESKNLTAVPADKDGWPDYQFLLDAGHASLWLEFKAPKGRTTAQQDERILTLRSLGFTARVVNSLTDFKKIVADWLASVLQ